MKKILMMGVIALSGTIVRASSLSSDMVIDDKVTAVNASRVNELERAADVLPKASENILSSEQASSAATSSDVGSANSGSIDQPSNMNSSERSFKRRPLTQDERKTLDEIFRALNANTSSDDPFIILRGGFFFVKSRIDVDDVETSSNNNCIKKARCKRLGEFLDKVALGEYEYAPEGKQNTKVGCANAQIILVLVDKARSKKNINTRPIAIRHRLLDEALRSLNCPQYSKSVEEYPRTAEELFLARYYEVCCEVYELSKLPSASKDSESLETYFERESLNDERIARIYHLLNEIDSSRNPSRFSGCYPPW